MNTDTRGQEPGWVVPFLDALRTGNGVRAAARMAG